MKISLAWLKDFIDITATPRELGRELTRIGLPVDALETSGADLGGFVVGRVVSAERHPNADKLTLCHVDVGAGEPLQIVCGAPNARAGGHPVVALVGATLPDGTRIRKAKLRGVESHGMMCSERELGLSGEHTGIIDLGEAAPEPGTPLDRVLTLGDTLYELDIPSNRGDCFSHLGVARELAALFGVAPRLPETAPVEAAEPAADRASVSVEDPGGCPRYIARVIEGIRVGPSPEWLVRKLAAIGQRSINNVVDVTNLVLWEMGQPLHAFDLDRLEGGRIVVRRARPGERLVTLDGQDRALTPEVLVIADAVKPVGLAGLMGGADSEVTATTTRILLESAWFDPFRVLRGTRACRLTTEASLRFVRGVDPAGVAPAADRCARLLAELAEGRVLAGRLEVLRPGFLESRRVRLRPGASARLLGEEIPEAEETAILAGLGFVAEGDGVYRVPPWRLDVRQECDLVEEVARFHGYDRLGERNANPSGLCASRTALDRGLEAVRRTWIGLGFSEMLTRALSDPAELPRSGFGAAETASGLIEIPDPPSREESCLRLSLLPGALRAVAHNLRHGSTELRLFEVDAVFRKDPAGPLAQEPLEVIAVATGGQFGPDLTRVDPVMDHARFRGLVETFLAAVRVDAPRLRCYDETGFEARTSTIIESRGRRIGVFGRLDPRIAGAWDIARAVYVARFTLSELLEAVRGEVEYREPSRFPASRRDMAFLVDGTIPEARVAEAIRELGGALLVDAVLFDRFTGKPLPEGKVSLAYALAWQAADRTLSDEDVRVAEGRVVEGLQERFGAQLRDR